MIREGPKYGRSTPMVAVLPPRMELMLMLTHHELERIRVQGQWNGQWVQGLTKDQHTCHSHGEEHLQARQALFSSCSSATARGNMMLFSKWMCRCRSSSNSFSMFMAVL